ALRHEFDHFIKALRTAVKARLDAEPGRNVTGERSIEAGELAVGSDIVERRLVSCGHGHDEFTAVEDSLEIRRPQIRSRRRSGGHSWSWSGRRLRCWRGAHHGSAQGNSEHKTSRKQDARRSAKGRLGRTSGHVITSLVSRVMVV